MCINLDCFYRNFNTLSIKKKYNKDGDMAVAHCLFSFWRIFLSRKKNKIQTILRNHIFLSSLRVIVAFYCSTSLTFMNFSLKTIISDISPTTMQTEMKNVTLYLLITGKSPENHPFFFSWNEFDPLTVFRFKNSLIFFLKKDFKSNATHIPTMHTYKSIN